MNPYKKFLVGIVLLLVAFSAFAQTNSVPAFGDDIPGLNVLPVKLRGWFLAALALAPFIGRAYQAVVNGGGLKGIFSALFLGTNTPKPQESPKE